MSDRELTLLLKHAGPITTAYWFYCPGCEHKHAYTIQNPKEEKDDRYWWFNGNEDSPTFTPSLMVDGGTDKQCHIVMTDGQIKYLADCHHDLKGKTVPMVKI